MVVEIVPVDSETSNGSIVETVAHGQVGVIILTSLQKLRHPLVRYYTGDLGSLHNLTPEMRSNIDEGTHELGVLRMYGRNRAESFKWQANFYELGAIEAAMRSSNWGVFDWQILSHIDNDTGEHMLEIKLIRPEPYSTTLTDSELTKELYGFFNIYPKVEHLFKIQFVVLQDMVRSETSGKIIRFLDKTN